MDENDERAYTPRMPQQKPGRSKQDYGTPPEFIKAVENTFGPLHWDLAATAENYKVRRFITPENNSLAQDWDVLEGQLWLNPPFADIAPWVEKASKLKSRPIDHDCLILVPASVGSEWFAKHVWGAAYVYLLRGRLSFDGKNPYPKDCMLLRYTGRPPALSSPTYVWDWRKCVTQRNVASLDNGYRSTDQLRSPARQDGKY